MQHDEYNKMHCSRVERQQKRGGERYGRPIGRSDGGSGEGGVVNGGVKHVVGVGGVQGAHHRHLHALDDESLIRPHKHRVRPLDGHLQLRKGLS